MNSFYWFVFLLLFLCFSTFNQAQSDKKTGDTINQLDVNNLKQGYWIVTNDQKKLPGYRPEQIVEEGTFNDSKKNGKWKFYFNTEKLKQVLTYNNNLPNGHAVFYYPNGNIREEGVWQNNRWTGEYKYYYENGNLKNNWTYNQQGNREGVQKYYHENGNLAIEGTWQNGKEDGVIKEYYEDGSVRSERVFNNGNINLAQTTNFKPKEKVVQNIELAPQALIKVPETEEAQKPFDGNGFYELKNKEGKIIRKGNFENGYLVDGEVYQYGTLGNVNKITHYKGGKIVKVEDFD